MIRAVLKSLRFRIGGRAISLGNIGLAILMPVRG